MRLIRPADAPRGGPVLSFIVLLRTSSQSMSSSSIETIAVHTGEHSDPNHPASSPDLTMASTFLMDTAEGFSINAFEDERPLMYTRWGNPTTLLLEKKLAAMESAEACLALASGMAATSTLLLGLLKSGDHVIVTPIHYPGTSELIRDLLPRFGISSSVVDPTDTAAIANAITPATKMIWIETPVNPTLAITDIKACADIAKAHKIQLVVDSTLATPIATRPIELGADFVVHSLTKYVGGHGDALGGCILGSKATLETLLSEAHVHYGGVISPFNAWLIVRGIATLPIRMRQHEETAMQIALFLDQHPEVARVNYPGLPSHPQHDLAKQQMANFGGLLSFQAKNRKRLLKRLPRDFKLFHHAVSLGHVRSLICYVDTEEVISASYNLNSTQQSAYRDWAGEGLFRISTGMENADELCEDIANVLGN